MTQTVRKTRSRPTQVSTYWERTHWPLQALYFLLPLLLLYEIGMALYAGDADITARGLLRAGFEIFGVTGYYLPGLLVVVFLVTAHLIRRDPWQPEPKLYLIMWLESFLLAFALFVFTLVLFRQPATEPLMGLLAASSNDLLRNIPDWQTGLVFSVGAGIYEELLFRLIAIALIHLLLVDLLKVPENWGAVLAIAGSALAFALYHFVEFDHATWTQVWYSLRRNFSLGYFAFYIIAGVYLAGVYLLRGFGIVAATHALYDVLVITAIFHQQPNPQ